MKQSNNKKIKVERVDSMDLPDIELPTTAWYWSEQYDANISIRGIRNRWARTDNPRLAQNGDYFYSLKQKNFLNYVEVPYTPQQNIDAWQTWYSYYVKDYVLESGKLYECLVDNVSWTFSTDLSNGFRRETSVIRKYVSPTPWFCQLSGDYDLPNNSYTVFQFSDSFQNDPEFVATANRITFPLQWLVKIYSTLDFNAQVWDRWLRITKNTNSIREDWVQWQEEVNYTFTAPDWPLNATTNKISQRRVLNATCIDIIESNQYIEVEAFQDSWGVLTTTWYLEIEFRPFTNQS